MEKTRKLVIIGDSAFAEVAYEYFTYDSPYEVRAFSVESPYLKRDSLFGVPVVPFENLQDRYPPEQHEAYAALVYTQNNRLRTRLYQEAKGKGYRMASYISSRAFVWRNCQLGEHCFIFENNVLQPFARIGDNVVLWSGNHVGHHSSVGDNCFIASQVVISGFVNIGKNCFLGVNVSVYNNVNIGDNCIIGAGAVVPGDLESRSIVRGPRST
jgi:sugar O-acyltransferase (sialic acid O-acetyltransferase NeuD family)